MDLFKISWVTKLTQLLFNLRITWRVKDAMKVINMVKVKGFFSLVSKKLPAYLFYDWMLCSSHFALSVSNDNSLPPPLPHHAPLVTRVMLLFLCVWYPSTGGTKMCDWPRGTCTRVNDPCPPNWVRCEHYDNDCPQASSHCCCGKPLPGTSKKLNTIKIQ